MLIIMELMSTERMEVLEQDQDRSETEIKNKRNRGREDVRAYRMHI